MMRAPALSAIHAVELRIAQSQLATRASLHRAHVALRTTLSRPSTLALVAGATGLFGFWLARRLRRQQPLLENGAAVARTASVAGLALAVIMRYGMQGLPLIYRQVRAAREKRAAQAVSGKSTLPKSEHTAPPVLH